MALSPPPGLPLPPSIEVVLIGDSGLAVYGGRKGKSIEWPMKAALHKAGLNKPCRVVSIPGAGATQIINQLVNLLPKKNTVIVVWLLNELFDQQGTLLSGNRMEKAEQKVRESARTLARTLRDFQHRMAVIGGSHKLWDVDEKFDEYVLAVTQIMKAEGIIVDNKASVYGKTELKQWHVVDNPSNLQLITESIVCPQSTASNQLRELMATLAKTWGDPIADVPKGQDGITVIHDYNSDVKTSYTLDRNTAYTVGRKNCGNGIELGNDADIFGASKLAAFLIPAPDEKMWVLVPTNDNEIKVSHRIDGIQKEPLPTKSRLICLPWALGSYYIDLGPWFGLVINTPRT